MHPKVEVPSASAQFPSTGLKPEQMVTKTQQVAEVVKSHPDYPNKPAIQSDLIAWLASAAALDKDGQGLKAARLAIIALLALLFKDVATWKRATKKMLAGIDEVCGGSEEAIKKWGLAARLKQLVQSSKDAPLGLRSTYTKTLVHVMRWKGVHDQLGYFIQMGDGTPRGWGPSIHCPKVKYEPQGLTLGQNVAFRVAVQRRSGLSVWSAAQMVTVR